MDPNAAPKRRWCRRAQNPCLGTAPRERPQPTTSALALLVMHSSQPLWAPPALPARVSEPPYARLAPPDHNALPDNKASGKPRNPFRRPAAFETTQLGFAAGAHPPPRPCLLNCSGRVADPGSEQAIMVAMTPCANFLAWRKAGRLEGARPSSAATALSGYTLPPSPQGSALRCALTNRTTA
ncbi:hypothetical protein NDU88_002683 [Pleurodeles waltl]|uniref:Uncharacterized protein n=1 Tax=Pleurodeles waltl TaxID=8319 RepID=A0AAV7T2P6_PLEWA|nr:hypothetical protein NDU88_002683 [Pleurodeles waltl]